MRIVIIMIVSLLLTNCTNSYVKNKKTITSPNDLQKFVNIYCNKNKSTDKVIKVCGNGWSKDLNISENKAANQIDSYLCGNSLLTKKNMSGDLPSK